MGGASASPWKGGKKKQSDREWEELGRKFEHKFMREVRSWVDEDAGADKDTARGEGDTSTRSERDEEWREIGLRVEEKIKRKVKKWAEEE
ncbi:MAG: hypothetical protein GY847_14640 [Proteobacteria bacterium]|nr:hypothetical protein [Pseudomonadota bacterium]